MKALLTTLALAAGVSSWASAQTPEPKAAPARQTFEVTRAASPVRIDGNLDEAAWAGAAVIELPYEYFPGDNAPAPVRTECLVTYDETSLYIAFRAYDPEPGAIRAHLADRDTITTFQQDDHVGFMLDLFNDERRAFQFRINPLGVQADAVFSELDGIEDFSWDAIWQSAGRITPEGWTVEVAVPFNQLRFPKTAGPQTWGLDLFRSYPRSFRYRIAATGRDRNRSCLLCQVHKITGLSGITPGRNLELDPTVTGHRTDQRSDFPSGPLADGSSKADVGVTARWGVTPNVILNATVNPDFSQVEADVAQLDVNNRFALFFPEKRPFFLEGIDFFATPLQVVFTRTVTDPQGGLKVTGKSGRDAFGVFLARDSVNNLILPSNQVSDFASLDQRVTSGVLRYRRDVGAGSTVGLVASAREADGYHNRLGGLDAFVRASATNTFRAQLLRSESEYPDAVVRDNGQTAGAFGGWGLDAEFAHTSNLWNLFAQYQDLGRAFRADSGFIPRVDVRTLAGNATRILHGTAGRWYSEIDLGLQASRTEDHDGRLTDQSLGGNIVYNGPRQSLLGLTLTRNKEFFEGITHELTRLDITGEIRPSGAARINFNGRVGGAIDVAGNRSGTLVSLGPALEYRFDRSLELRLAHDFQRLTLSQGRLFDANLTQGRLVYHFGTRAFARAILQYRNTRREVALYPVAVPVRSQQLFSQLLFSYKLNPQTVLLLGYSDNAQARPGIDLTKTDRSFFVKVGYAWVL
jgi:hypothetical protein